jgi:hypothetical protein
MGELFPHERECVLLAAMFMAGRGRQSGRNALPVVVTER